jgi:LysR family transcriptional regulator, glycine cleavage system transcriptional activator
VSSVNQLPTLNRRNLPLNALRCFEAAARHCHLRRAARELGITHGAISRQVRILEEAVGSELFDRTHRRMQLTAGGQRLLHVVRDALDRVTEAALYLDPEMMAGSITIATTPSISVYWLIPVLGEFSVRYPEVELRMVNIEPRLRVLPADVDIAICFGAPDAPRHNVRELYREVFFPVASPKLLSGRQSIQQAADLLRFTLIHDRHGQWPRWFEAQGLAGARAPRNFFVQEAFQAVIAAREGFGVAITDRIEVANELREGSLVRLSDGVADGLHPIVMVSEADDRLPLRARVFIDHLHKALQARLHPESTGGPHRGRPARRKK